MLTYCRQLGEQLLEALAVYKREHGNVAVPVRYIIPESSSYPEDVWGMPLGMRVAKVCKVRTYPLSTTIGSVTVMHVYYC
jgi:hypothetical protein